MFNFDFLIPRSKSKKAPQHQTAQKKAILLLKVSRVTRESVEGTQTNPLKDFVVNVCPKAKTGWLSKNQ